MTKYKQIPRNSNQYSNLSSIYFVKSVPVLDKVSHKAHDLYNCALYVLRQGLFNKKYVKGYQTLDTIFKTKYSNRESMLYHQLGYVQSAQQTLKEITGIWKAYWHAEKAFSKNPSKFSGKPRLPHYLRKGKLERHIFFVTNQNAKVRNGYLVIPKLGFKLKLDPKIKKIQRVGFKPAYKGYDVIVQYKINKIIKYLPDNGKYIGIDPGVDNAFACVSNTAHNPLLINGKAIKSVNQYYNKKHAKLKHKQAKYHQLEYWIQTKQGLKPIYKETDSMKAIANWRNRKIKAFAHKASKRIVEYALNCGANTIVIGNNKNWKRSSNMGKRNNQNFIGIPHDTIIDMITYKANLKGISVIRTNESYTSQTSALDNEKPCWTNGNESRKKQGLKPFIRRIHRGLFKTNKGLLINADVNGAMQIIRKVFPKVSFTNGIGDIVLCPSKWSPII